MANYAVWNIRKRHEWLATPLRKKRVKRRNAARIGLLDAQRRHGAAAEPPQPTDETASAAAPQS